MLCRNCQLLFYKHNINTWPSSLLYTACTYTASYCCRTCNMLTKLTAGIYSTCPTENRSTPHSSSSPSSPSVLASERKSQPQFYSHFETISLGVLPRCYCCLFGPVFMIIIASSWICAAYRSPDLTYALCLGISQTQQNKNKGHLVMGSVAPSLLPALLL